MLRLIQITILWLLSGCIFANANPHPVRIALVGPFSGKYAAYGTQLLSGATQAMNDINHAGGIQGVKLEIVPIDDQCDPNLALEQATNIVKDKYFQVVIGHVCSACTLATANIYSKANILVITPTSTHAQITQRGIDTMFRMTGKNEQQAAVAANFIANKLHSKRIAILYTNDIYSKNLADKVSEQLLRLDKAPIMHQAINNNEHNYSTIVKKLKQLNADAVYFPALYPEVSSLANALYALQLQIPLLAGDGLAVQQYVRAVGGPKIAHSSLMTFVTDPKAYLSSKTTIHKMQQQKLDTSGYALYAYATMQVIAKAIESTNQTEGNILANWLHQHEVDTVLGKKSWDTNGDIIDSNFKIYAWRDETNLESL